MQIFGDSLVLVDEQPGKLCFAGIRPGTIQVRSQYEPGMTGCQAYEEGRDYQVDDEQGTIARTPGSRIPNFRANILFGVKGFDHTRYPKYGNHDYFIWVDYDAPQADAFAQPNGQAHLLPRSVERLQSGGPFKVISYGDSITAGGEATEERLRYQEMWVAQVAGLYPKAHVMSENGATGGDASFQGLERLETKVLSRNPDLVLIAFGMNDLRTPYNVFKQNLLEMVKRIREATQAEVMLITTFPPNPDWAYASGNSDEIAQATREVALEAGCPLADVHAVWDKVLQRKDLPSLLGNNINHPNNFGHWLYLQALLATFPG